MARPTRSPPRPTRSRAARARRDSTRARSPPSPSSAASGRPAQPLAARTPASLSVFLRRVSVSRRATTCRSGSTRTAGACCRRSRSSYYYLVIPFAGDARLQQRLLLAVRVLADTPILPSALLDDNGWDGAFAPDETVELASARLTRPRSRTPGSSRKATSSRRPATSRARSRLSGLASGARARAKHRPALPPGGAGVERTLAVPRRSGCASSTTRRVAVRDGLAVAWLEAPAGRWRRARTAPTCSSCAGSPACASEQGAGDEDCSSRAPARRAVAIEVGDPHGRSRPSRSPPTRHPGLFAAVRGRGCDGSRCCRPRRAARRRMALVRAELRDAASGDPAAFGVLSTRAAVVEKAAARRRGGPRGRALVA